MDRRDVTVTRPRPERHQLLEPLLPERADGMPDHAEYSQPLGSAVRKSATALCLALSVQPPSKLRVLVIDGWNVTMLMLCLELDQRLKHLFPRFLVRSEQEA